MPLHLGPCPIQIRMYILLYILTAERIATKVMLRGVKLADCPISCASCLFGA